MTFASDDTDGTVDWDCKVCTDQGTTWDDRLSRNQLAAEVQHRHGKGRCDKVRQ